MCARSRTLTFMAEKINQPRLADNTAESEFLDQLTSIEKMLLQDNVEGARRAIAELKPQLNRHFENAAQKSELFTNIENRVSHIEWQLDPPNGRSGDEG